MVIKVKNIFLIIFCFAVFNNILAQTNYAKNVDFVIKNNIMCITYDIITENKNDMFNVSVNLQLTSTKSIYVPQTVSGDIGNNVFGGTNKKIIWEISKDIPNPDEEGIIEVVAKLQLNPDNIISYSGSNVLCKGGSILLEAKTGYDYLYQWKKDGNFIPDAIDSKYMVTTSGNYTVDVFGNNFSITSSPVKVTEINMKSNSVVINPLSSTSFCQGSSVMLKFNNEQGLSYQWQKNSSNIEGALIATYEAKSSGKYALSVTNSYGCSFMSQPVIVTVKRLPDIKIFPQSETTFYQGGSVFLEANKGKGLTYQWKKNSKVFPKNTYSYFAASSTGDYSVMVTDSNNCTSESSIIAITVKNETSPLKALFLSIILPGLGNKKVSNKSGYFLFGFSGYACFTGGFCFIYNMQQNYNKYKSSTDVLERKSFYEKTILFQRNANILFIAAGGIWFTDFLITAIQTKKKNRIIGFRNKISVGYCYNNQLNGNLLMLKYKF